MQVSGARCAFLCVSIQDKVVASRLPNHWALKSIFITGIVYGLYLTLSSWALYYVATHTSFFREHLKMHDLRYKPDSYLAEWCLSDNNPNRNVSPAVSGHGLTVLACCVRQHGTDRQLHARCMGGHVPCAPPGPHSASTRWPVWHRHSQSSPLETLRTTDALPHSNCSSS